MLDFPLHDGFFPPIVLSTQEVKYYRRLGKERVGQLVRIIEDAECAYKWTPCRPPPKLPPPYAATASGGASGSHPRTPVVCQRAQFLDLQPTSKATRASTLLKASAQLADARPEEALQALAKLPTRDLRKMMAYVHGGAFVDARTLFTLPSSSSGGKRNPDSRPPYSYRAIKWHALRAPQVPKTGGGAKHDKSASSTQIVDFCYLEYAGARRGPRPGSNVVGFIVQESITRAREVPSLARFGVARGTLARVGIFVSRVAHQPATCRVTALCQLDDMGDQLSASGGMSVDPAVLAVVMQRALTGVVGQLAGLLERQRVSRLRFVEQWQWIPNAERKACAVCLRGFYFHRKHHCRTCGEVVCSGCAPLRELEEPIFDISHLRVCSVCMLAAANTGVAVTANGYAASSGLGSTSTGDDEETYARGLRSPRHDSYEDMVFHLRGRRDRDIERARPSDAERKSDVVAPMVLRPQDKLQVLTNVVSRIRDIRDTIDMTISEVDAGGAAVDDGDHSDTSGGADDAHDLYSEMQSIRDALETSVSQFDAALASATGMDDEEDDSEDGRSAIRRGRSGSDQDDEGMTPDQFHSVARITLAAARATKQAGEAFLSSAHDVHQQHRRHRRHTHERQRQYGHESHHRPRRHRREANDLLAELGANHTDGGDSSVASSHSNHTNDGDESDEEAEDPYAASNYEKLMRATRSPKDEEEASHAHSEPDSHDAAGDGTLTDSSAGASSSSASSSMRSSRDIKKMMTRTKSAKIRALEQQIRELQRCLDDAQRKLSVMESDDLTALDLGKQRQRQRQMSRPSNNEPLKATTTTDLVSELRGVMNSSEVAKANNNGRHSLTTKPAPRKPSPQEPFANVSTALPSPIAVVPEEDAFDGMDTPPVVQKRKQYPQQQQQPKGLPNGRQDSIEKTNILDKTASSSFGSTLATEKTNVNRGKPRSPAATVDPQALGISDSGEWDDLSDSDDDDDDNFEDSHSYSSSEPQFERPTHHRDSRTEKDNKGGTAFFEEEDLNALLRQRTSVVAAAEVGGGRHSLLAAGLPPDDATDVEDESTELRELMAALARPRSNSLPLDTDSPSFGPRGAHNQHGGTPSQEVTANPSAGAGGGAAGVNAPLQPSWSDGSPERGPTAHHVDHAVRAIRACLASLRCECPSTTERRRRLAGVAQILKSLRRDGVRSRFRTLAHAELGYAQLLQRAPSVVKLLKLAGYVSLPQKLTMRRVDSEFLALVLRELERELDGDGGGNANAA